MIRKGSADTVIDQCLIEFINGTIHAVIPVLKSLRNKRLREGSFAIDLLLQASSTFTLFFQVGS